MRPYDAQGVVGLRPRARRRSELRTTNMRTILLIALVQAASLAACCELRAEAPADSLGASQPPARPTIQKPITREDADLMLREAHSAIEQGRFDAAEKIISRVESARVQFPLFHTGPTPAALRKELSRAERLRSASKSLSHDAPSGAKKYLPFSRPNSGQANTATDPFANRSHNVDPISAPTSTASQNSISPVTGDRRLAGISAPATLPSDSQSPRARSLDNPFTSSENTAGLNPSASLASDPPSTEGPLGYPTMPSAKDDSSQARPSPSARTQTASTLHGSGDTNPSWQLPSAPLPRGASDQQFAASGSNLMPPKHNVASASASNSRTPASASKQQAQEDLSAARKALSAGDVDLAEKLTQAANSLGVPESQFLPDEDRPSLVAWDIARAKQKERPQPAKEIRPQAAKETYPQSGIARLPSTLPASGPTPRYEASPSARYDTQPVQATNIATSAQARRADASPAAYRVDENDAQSPPITPILEEPVRRTAQAAPLAPAKLRADQGPLMLAAKPDSPASDRNDRPVGSDVVAPPTDDLPLPGTGNAAVISDANELPKPATAVAAPAAVPAAPAPPVATELPAPLPKPQSAAIPPHKSLIDSADEAQQIVLRKLDGEVLKRQSEAVRLREKDPERALATLREAQQLVNESKLPESTRRELLNRIDKTMHDTQQYVKGHGAQIDLDKRNEAVLAGVDHDREMKVKLQQKIAEQVEEFNRLNHEQRFAEAEIVARRLNEIAPEDPVAKQVWINAKMIRREKMNRQLVDDKESSVWEQLNAVEDSAINPVAKDGQEMVYDQKKWKDFIPKRKGNKERTQRHSERELEIERRLQTPVLLKYQETPLTEVMTGLSELTGVNIHLDPRGLSQEGVNTDTPITINLSKEISLKSALNLILEPLHLSYVINDEVLKITSEQLRDGEIYPQTYSVADLVTPIPNFVPSSNMGLQGLINDSMAAAGHGSFGVGNNGPAVLVNDRPQRPGVGPNGRVLAQQLSSQPVNPNGMPTSTPIGGGPGGMGAAANADFDSLIDLIVSTVSTDTWAENGGGQAEIRPFPTNLSLVISQTQAVHEQIADLLQQLRRLQDLQVTIEVRFIRLNDSFFERIGIDFNMQVKDHGVDTGNTTTNPFQPFPGGTLSNTVGAQRQGTGNFPTFTSDLDIPFNQNSFALTQVTPFGGPVGGGLNFGFAILSDIEAFFLVEAAQGDRRTNVLNAPKITLFNGQQAFVADATQRPFVVGVIPVVGEFASAQQPVIVVLNEGTMMTIQAVVSDDRRYVRMTIVPFFTQIGNVDTFTFEGSTSSTSSSSSATDKTGNDTTSDKKDDSKSNNNTGVTVQLPSFSFVSVVTTVSVPDGGTVLLGGIKRLSEGRNEFGVPLLSKVPYINRLFKNVAIGRETDSLMMMVTPRIIIQEEEEERLGIAAP
jgi:type II secretory pathway component GspD/PulD (secretin)